MKFCSSRKGDLLPHTHFNCEIAVTETMEWFLENQFYVMTRLEEEEERELEQSYVVE